MKMISVLIILITCLAFRTNENNLMTRLIIEKKSLQEALVNTKENAKEFDDKAVMLFRSDTLLENNFFDSASKYFLLSLKQQKRLAAINFSIDSLSEIK